MQICYLDQNKWIDLIREREGQTPDHAPDFSNVSMFVEEASQNDSFEFPIDLCRIQEAAARGDDKSRSTLFEYMWEISDGWGFAPQDVVSIAEAREAVRRRTGHGDHLAKEVCGKGMTHITGCPLDRIRHESGEWLLDQINDDDIGLAYEIAQSHGLFKDATTGGGLEGLRELHDTKELANMLNGWDDEIKEELSDRDKQRRASMIKHYAQIILPEFAKWWTQVGFDPMSLPVEPEDWSEYMRVGRDAKTAESFLQEFPSSYCFNELRFRRELEGKPFEANNVRDIQSLSVAIPYSDVVVCENHFGSLAKQSNLGDVFNSTITTDLHDLPDIV